MSGCSFESRDNLIETNWELSLTFAQQGCLLQPEASPEVCAVCATVARAVAALQDPEG